MMLKIKTGFIIIIYSLLITHLIHPDNDKTILILNSYHEGFTWTDGIVKGIKETLNKKHPGTVLYIEYMDTKRFFDGLDGTYINNLKEKYELKYKNINLDLIISSDDNAFNFLLENHVELFKDTPIVFCGVNYFDQSMLDNHNNITGLVEKFDVIPTFELANKINPDINKIYVISDQTPTGKANRLTFEKTIDKLPNKADFIFLDSKEYSLKELIEKIKILKKNDIIFFLDFYKDKNYNYYPIKQLLNNLSKHSKIPIYSHSDVYLGHGIVGGYLNSSYHTGLETSKIALKILAGEKIENLPVEKNSPNKFIFDYKQLKKNNINISDLPKESIIINHEKNFFQKNKTILWQVIIIIIILLIIIIIFFFIILKIIHTEKLLMSLIEGVPDGILVFDINGKILHCNEVICSRLGYSESELLKLSIRKIEAPEYLYSLDQRLSNQLTKKKHACESIHITKDGKRIPVDINSSKINYHGKTAILAIIRNISDRKKAEKEKENLLNELQSKNKELESIVYVTSHDLRSPLVNIQGFSSELRLTCKTLKAEIGKTNITLSKKKKLLEIIDNETEESLNFIYQSINKMDKLLKGLLKISRLGSAKLDIQNVNIKKLIKNILNEIQFQLLESKVKISIGNLPNCYCDLIQINQVFTNLIDNAIKYLRSDIKGIIKIDGYKENNKCIYTIEDNGIGIEIRHNKKIFEIFHRLNPVKSIKGEGLGLTIVKRIIDRHNGKIWVESKKGKGSKFYISLPYNE